MNDASHLVLQLLEDDDEDAKDFVERSWVLDVDDLKASLEASGFKAIGVHVLRRGRWESADDAHVHLYVEGHPSQPFPIERQVEIKNIVAAWAAAAHVTLVSHYWVPTVITRSAHMYHLDTFIMPDPQTKIINTDN